MQDGITATSTSPHEVGSPATGKPTAAEVKTIKVKVPFLEANTS